MNFFITTASIVIQMQSHKMILQSMVTRLSEDVSHLSLEAYVCTPSSNLSTTSKLSLMDFVMPLKLVLGVHKTTILISAVQNINELRVVESLKLDMLTTKFFVVGKIKRSSGDGDIKLLGIISS